MRTRDFVQAAYEKLDALAARDPSDVQDEGGPLVEPEAGAQYATRRRGRNGKAVRADGDAPRIDSGPDELRALDLGRRDEQRGAAHDRCQHGRVERALERDLPEFRPEHAQRLQHVRDSPTTAPPGDPRPQRIAEPEDVHDVWSGKASEHRRQARRHPHPTEPERRGEIAHVRAVELDLPRAYRPAVGQVDERGGEDVDIVAAGYETPGERPQHADGTAKSGRGPVCGCREQDAEAGQSSTDVSADALAASLCV